MVKQTLELVMTQNYRDGSPKETLVFERGPYNEEWLVSAERQFRSLEYALGELKRIGSFNKNLLAITIEIIVYNRENPKSRVKKLDSLTYHF